MLTVSSIKYNTYTNTYTQTTRISDMRNNSEISNVYYLPQNISFGSARLTDKDYENAVKYLEDKHPNKRDFLSDYDLEKLNGIQKGIKIFDGLTMEEINYVVKNLRNVLVMRGCRNMCKHCYANSLPKIQRMNYEDYKDLFAGFEQLNERLGFNVFNEIKSSYNNKLVLFHDSDCLNMFLVDKDGNKHDFIDINEIQYKVTGMPGLFDTLGWNPKNTKMQELAEKYVRYFEQLPHSNSCVEQINLSVTPFSGIYAKSIELKEKGLIEQAKELHDIYINSAANMFYTFTPLINKGRLGVISTFALNLSLKHFERLYPFRVSELNKIKREVLAKLDKMYNEDLMTNQKYVKSIYDKKSFLSFYDKQFFDNSDGALLMGRMLDFCDEKVNSSGLAEEIRNKILKSYLSSKYEGSRINGIIDINGQFYLQDVKTADILIPTYIKLNYKDKNKTTNPLNREDLQDFTIKSIKPNAQKV